MFEFGFFKETKERVHAKSWKTRGHRQSDCTERCGGMSQIFIAYEWMSL